MSASRHQLLAVLAHLQQQQQQQSPKLSLETVWKTSAVVRQLAHDCAAAAAAASSRGNNKHEERQEQRDDTVVVWACDDGTDQGGSSSDDENGSVEYLNLDDDNPASSDQSEGESDDPFVRGEKMTARMLMDLGFINKRHAMFAAAGVIPEPREVEMWQDGARFLVAAICRAATPGATILAAAVSNLHVQQDSKSSDDQSRPADCSTTAASASAAAAGVHFSSSPPRFRKRKPTLTLRTLLQLLGGSAQELSEFEHAPLIVAQLPVTVLSRQTTPLEALQQLWRVFAESECNGRLSAACVAALDKVFTGVMTHQKVAAEVGSKCAVLFIKMLCSMVACSDAGGSAARWQSLGSADEAAVVDALISTVLSTAKVQMLDAVDPTAFLFSVSNWGGGHMSALIELRCAFQAKFAATASDTFARLGKTSAHVAALKRIVIY